MPITLFDYTTLGHNNISSSCNLHCLHATVSRTYNFFTMVLRAVLIATIVCFTLTLTGTASTGVLQPTQVKVSSNALQLIEDIIKQEIHSNLVKTYLGLAPGYAAYSCKQIALQN